MHPMTRDSPQRRRLGPVIVNKSSSQDRLIQELQGRFGLGRPERRHRRQPDPWLTPGQTASQLQPLAAAAGGAVEPDQV